MTKYQLYLCDISSEHKPMAKFEADTPFMPVSVGQRFDDHGWQRLDNAAVAGSEQQPKRYIVHSVKHTVYESKGILYIQYWINLNPYHGPGSPVWHDD